MSFTLTLNGREVVAQDGQTILDVARASGVDIPTMCHRDGLQPFAACFICVVEVKGAPRLLPACATPAVDGMVVETASDKVVESRKMCLKLMLSDHVGDCRAPCQVRCPAGIDIPGFIALLAEGKFSESVRLLKESLPFPSSIGRVCPRFCEEVCRRAGVDEPISICSLHRFVADEDSRQKNPYVPSVLESTGKKVAIVGAGPAGLSCAFYLAKLGYKVVVMDAQSEPGGMLRYGIPSYRLPRDVLAREIQTIKDMGVEIRCNTRFGDGVSLETLAKKYDAVFLGFGAWQSSKMQIEGEDEAGVLYGIEFLHDVATGVHVEMGDEAVVVGGGNTAVDTARTALRLGAKKARIFYRRTREEMPADDAEVEALIKEGVEIEFLVAPVGVRRSGRLLSLRCVRMELGEPDKSGRRRPLPIEGSEFDVNAGTVIAAIGQTVDASCLYDDPRKIKISKWSTVEVDERTFGSNIKGVFAGGDCVSGPDVAITAIANGRKAALSIHQYLSGYPVRGEDAGYLHSMGERIEDVPPQEFEGWKSASRSKMPELKLDRRIKSFEEVEKGFSFREAKKEAERCMACGCRTHQSCELRKLSTEYGADPKRLGGANRHYFLDESHPLILYEEHKCIMCGACVRVCSEVKHLDALGFVARGFAATVKPSLEGRWVDSSCDACLKCVPMCPTGAITLKVTPADEARVRWSKNVDASKDVEGKSPPDR